jgi:hypothetical protein
VFYETSSCEFGFANWWISKSISKIKGGGKVRYRGEKKKEKR